MRPCGFRRQTARTCDPAACVHRFLESCGQKQAELLVASRVIVCWAVDIAVGVRAERTVQIPKAARPLAVAAVIRCQHQESIVPHILLAKLGGDIREALVHHIQH